jgi:NAD(P)-dependent dehydrogenase (short-subunit alcohol dehydrogenase family)
MPKERFAMPAADHTALLVGASRGLGLGLAREYLARGWRVIATAREDASGLESLAADAGERLRIERLDVADLDGAAALRERLAGERIDLLFVVAGISGPIEASLHEVAPETAAQVFLVNAYYPVCCAEALADLVGPGGVIAFMSSLLGSIGSVTLNARGGWEIYRGSKAALNMLSRGFAARHPARSVLVIAPGWVRTDMGGPNATFDVETAMRNVANVIEKRQGSRGHLFVAYDNSEVPW